MAKTRGKTEPDAGLGPRIRQLRYRRGLTQAQLAFKAGVGEKTLKRLEGGKTDSPHPETIGALAGALGIAPQDLFVDEIASEPEPQTPGKPAVHQLPRPPPNFTGREDELKELEAQLDSRGATISGIQGMGGVGKTALALTLAERWADRFEDGQFFIDMHGSSEPLSATDAMLHVIRSLDPNRLTLQTDAEIEAAYRSVLRDKRALILVDNAAGREQVERLMPPDGCVLLITSRQRFALPGLHALQLEPMPSHDARRLLETLAPRADAVGAHLADLCAGLPLALSLAGRALAERPDVDPADYAARLANDRERIEQLDRNDTAGGVSASIDMSFGMLDGALQQRLTSLAVFPQDFDRSAAMAVWDVSEDDADDHIGQLLRFNLLEWNGMGHTARYGLHDLVRLFGATRLEEGARGTAQLRHAHHYRQLLTTADNDFRHGRAAEGLGAIDREWMNIREAFRYAEEHSEQSREAAELCARIPNAATVLRLRLHPAEQLRWCEAGLRAAAGLEDRALAGWLESHAGRAHHALGEPRRILDCCERSLAIAREIDNRFIEAHALIGLGDGYHALGNPDRAIERCEAGLAIARELQAEPEVVYALVVLGWAHYVRGESRRTLECGQLALPIARALGDRTMEDSALLFIGLAHQTLGEPDLAREYCEASLEIAREIGDRRIEGYALLSVGDPRQSPSPGERALELAREVGDRRLEGNALIQTGVAHATQRQYKQAAERYAEALELAHETGDRHLEANALLALGAVHAAQAQHMMAIEYYDRSLQAARAIGNSREQALASWLLGCSLEETGDLARAADAMQVWVDFLQEMEHPRIDRSRRRLEAVRKRLKPDPS